MPRSLSPASPAQPHAKPQSARRHLRRSWPRSCPLRLRWSTACWTWLRSPPTDVVYDLGCGDGRLVITAAKRYGARGVGVDIDPALIAQSRANAKKEGVDRLVEFRQQDALTVDLSPASVVTLYLLTEANLQLRPRLQAQLKPGRAWSRTSSGWATGSRRGPRRSPIASGRRG